MWSAPAAKSEARRCRASAAGDAVPDAAVLEVLAPVPDVVPLLFELAELDVLVLAELVAAELAELAAAAEFPELSSSSEKLVSLPDVKTFF